MNRSISIAILLAAAVAAALTVGGISSALEPQHGLAPYGATGRRLYGTMVAFSAAGIVALAAAMAVAKWPHGEAR